LAYVYQGWAGGAGFSRLRQEDSPLESDVPSE
jgi:hypothetical protein